MNVKFCGITKKPIKSCHEHSHKYCEIIYNTSGKNKTIIDGEQYDISKGDIMIIPHDIFHRASTDTYYTDIFIQCKYMDFSGVLISHDHDKSILSLVKLLYKTMTEKENSYEIISDKLLEVIFLYLKKYADTNYKYIFVRDLKNEIYENISNSDFEILDFSKRNGINIDYLRRCFKYETGKTPLEYLTQIRLNHAKDLLKHEAFLSISDVAKLCGYKDSFYFSRLFKKKFNVSPLKYRNTKRVNPQ